MSVVIITDGSAHNGTGHGGWAAIIRHPSSLVELTGFADATTSNRMELTAAIEGLRHLSTPEDVTLVTDSAYLCNTLNRKWYERWFKDEERGIKGKPRPNLDLWRQLVGLIHFHNVKAVKVKGHSGDYWNHRADRLADFARRDKSSSTHSLEEWVDERCPKTSEYRESPQCKLHAGHTGTCLFTNGKANGVEPYGDTASRSHRKERS